MSDLNLVEIKELARKFSPEEMEGCITEQFEIVLYNKVLIFRNKSL